MKILLLRQQSLRGVRQKRLENLTEDEPFLWEDDAMQADIVAVFYISTFRVLKNRLGDLPIHNLMTAQEFGLWLSIQETKRAENS
jgi:hypothetical protein